MNINKKIILKVEFTPLTVHLTFVGVDFKNFVSDHDVLAYKQTIASHPKLFKQAENLHAFWPQLAGG